ncbi:MAG: condensation domain-containing protein, partial [Bacteroidota bacterium]
MEISKLKLSLSEDYWFEKLSNPVRSTAFNKDSYRNRTGGIGRVQANMPKELSQKLKEIGDKNETSAFLLLSVALNVLLSKYTQSNDIITATTHLHLKSSKAEDTLLFFRLSLTENATIKTLLKESLAQLNAAHGHRHYAFSELKRRLNISGEGDLDFAKQFGLVYNRFNEESPMRNEIATLFEVENIDGKFCVSIRYQLDHYDPSMMGQLLKHYLVVLTQILKSTEQRVSKIVVMDEAEQLKLKDAVNNTETHFPADKTIVDLFEEQVAKTPDHPAVKFKGITYTYRD